MFPTTRDAVDYIMDTFPIVRKKDENAHGSYRTKDTILAIYDQMADAGRTGQPYQTRLDPPAGPAVAPDGSFRLLPEWNSGEPRPEAWPPHIHAPREVFDWATDNGIDWRTLYEPEQLVSARET